MMIEGSGSGPGSVPVTNGSGSRRPKNIQYGSDGSGSATLPRDATKLRLPSENCFPVRLVPVSEKKISNI
jgi:hypothetical protein